MNFTCLWKDTHVKKENFKTKSQRPLAAQWEGQTADSTAEWLEISSSGWLLCVLGAVHVCLPGSWITAAIENQRGPELPCVYRINAQTRGLWTTHTSVLFQSESAAQPPPSSLHTWSTCTSPTIRICTLESSLQADTHHKWVSFVKSKLKPPNMQVPITTEISALKGRIWWGIGAGAYISLLLLTLAALGLLLQHSTCPVWRGEGTGQTSVRSCLSPLWLLNDTNNRHHFASPLDQQLSRDLPNHPWLNSTNRSQVTRQSLPQFLWNINSTTCTLLLWGTSIWPLAV